MGNWGKMIGGAVGFLFGGPGGAVVGAGIGCLIDNDAESSKALNNTMKKVLGDNEKK